MENKKLFFFSGSEAGKEASAVDWNSTELGDPESWPVSLKSLLAFLFRSRQPMCLFWGDDLRCFYNEALRPMVRPGEWSPMGIRLAVDSAAAETWRVMSPFIRRVLNEKISLRALDDMVPLFRDDRDEEVYWVYNYSPIDDDQGRTRGVLVVCTETTSHVLRDRELQASEERLRASLNQREALCRRLRLKNEQLESAWQRLEAIFNDSPAAMAVMQGTALIFEKVNPRYTALIGGRPAVGRAFFDVLSELSSTPLASILKEVYETGRPFLLHEQPFRLIRPHGRLEEVYLDGSYVRLNDASGQPYGIYTHLVDVTDRVLSRKRAEESRQQLRLALDSAQMGTWHVDLKTNSIVISEQLAIIFGRSVHDDLLSADASLIHPEDIEELRRTWQLAITNRSVWSHEFRIVRNDGEARWVYASGRAIYASNGEPLSVAGVTMDINERKSAEEVVQRAEAQIRNLAESMPQMAFIVDGDGRPEYLNQNFYDYLARPIEAPPIPHWLEESVVHPEDQPEVFRVWEDSRTSGSPFQVEYRLRRHDGEYRWHLGRATPVHDSRGRLVRWYGTNTDIHDQKMYEEELRIAKDQAESANRSKSAFLANMSHEIRTPLGAILGFSELLRDSRSEGEKAEYAQIIERNGKVLTKLIDDILDLSKVESGHMELEKVAVRLPSLVTEVVSLFEDRARRHRLDLTLDIDPATPEVVITDPTRLRQILVNLLGNALKFTSRGFVRLRVFPRREGAGGRNFVHFKITDSGVGMNSEQASRLFAPFSQADSSTTRKFGGSGLGLVLSRRLAQALGGDVTLDQYKPDEGCTFTASIEAIAAPSVAIDERRPAMDKEQFAAWMASRRAHVLLVEDSPDNQMLVSLLLKKAGIDVDIASNGREGVDKASSDEYDVILMDMQMPILDGYAATEELRSKGYDRPIVALTAHAMAEEKERILAAGCDAHLTKPLNSDLLLRTIQNLVPQVH